MAISETRRAWLAGIWDGEGSITIFEVNVPGHRRDGKKKPNKLAPVVGVTNCCPLLINEVLSITSELGVNLHVVQTRKQDEKNRLCYNLNTRNAEGVKKILEFLMPYLISKKPQAEIVLRYVNGRLALMEKTGRKNLCYVGYTDEDREAMRDVRGMNKKGPREELSESSEAKGAKTEEGENSPGL